jgi:hypothetical protein
MEQLQTEIIGKKSIYCYKDSNSQFGQIFYFETFL